MKKKKKSGKLGPILGGAVGGALGGLLGYAAMEYLDRSFAPEGLGEELLLIAGLVVGITLAVFVQLVIHEAGHLVFGLLSGYRFGSFRIGSFMWMKEEGELRLKRLTIAGTGGQCLMSPPDMVDGELPVVLYNLGGPLMNVLAGAVFLLLRFPLREHPIPGAILLLLGVSGFILAATNGIPMRMGTIDNDGYNAFALTRDPEARRAFWVLMKAQEQTVRGVRLRDMPEAWFEVPTDEAMKNSMVVQVGVFAANRLTDAHRFDQADALMEHLLSIDSGMVGLHRGLLICDRAYIELLGENRPEVLEELLDKGQKKFMKQMKNFPSVLRTEYAYALLREKDGEKARKIKEEFERRAKTYPYQSDIESERELMELAERI